MSSIKPKPVVGQKLFAEMHAGRGNPMRREWGNVTKVGRKFFEVEFGYVAQSFHLNTWERSGDNVQANSPTNLYISEQECEDRILRDSIAGNLSDKLRYLSDWRKLTLDQVKQIQSIVDP